MNVIKPGEQNFLFGLLGNFGLVRASSDTIPDNFVCEAKCSSECNCNCNCNCNDPGFNF
ncbi:MAG: hypothetical protein GOV15_01420 [Candidatus Diapherotrites archaeon]|nr:hypothetical protein [Candidatus Diapherotrites archaeon]